MEGGGEQGGQRLLAGALVNSYLGAGRSRETADPVPPNGEEQTLPLTPSGRCIKGGEGLREIKEKPFFFVRWKFQGK